MNDDDLRAAYAQLTAAIHAPADGVTRVRQAIAARRRHQLTAASGLAAAAVVSGVFVAADISGTGDRDSTPPVVRPTTPTQTTGSAGRLPSYAELHAIDAYQWESSFGQYRKDLVALAQSYDNYTGYRLNFELRSLRILGAGDAPPAVAEMIKDGPTRAHPVWVSMLYSYKDLKQAERALFRVVPRTSMGSVRSDLTGVVIGVFGKSISPARENRLQTIARSVTEVPVTFIAGHVVPASRSLVD